MKKITSLVMSLLMRVTCFSFTGFAADTQSQKTTPMPETIIWSDETTEIVFLGVEEGIPSTFSLRQAKNYNFSFLARAKYTNGVEVDVAEFNVSHQSIYNGSKWEFDSRGIYSHTAKSFPFRLVYWECTYFGNAYLQSAFRYEWNGKITSSDAIKFNLNTTSGVISLG